MQSTISCLIKACELNNTPYQTFDDNGHCLMVNDQWFFQINRTPFNTESMAALCKDKEHQYQLLQDKIRMPKTLGFMDFNVKSKFADYLKHKSMAAIVNSIETEFNYPVVVKPNRGALGINVFFCHNQDQVIEALQTIYRKDQDYDYIALAQQYIKPKQEFRVIFFDGEPVLSYERYFENAGFGARYWETEEGKALALNDNPLVARAKQEFAAIFKLPGLRFVGLDIVLDENDQLYCLELNSGPKVNHFIENNNADAVVQMYSYILKKL